MSDYGIARKEAMEAFTKLRDKEAKDPLALVAIRLGEVMTLMVIGAAEDLNRIATALEEANRLKKEHG